jgi:hypothetical protein
MVIANEVIAIGRVKLSKSTIQGTSTTMGASARLITAVIRDL